MATKDTSSSEGSGSSDPDYEPSESGEEETSAGDGGSSADGNGSHPPMMVWPILGAPLILGMMGSGSPPPPPPPPEPRPRTRRARATPHPSDSEGAAPRRAKRTTRASDILTKGYSRQERAYFDRMPEDLRQRVLSAEEDIRNGPNADQSSMPLRFRILTSGMDRATRQIVLNKADHLQNMFEGSGEYSKLRNWIDGVCKVPFGRFTPLPIQPSDPAPKVAAFLQGIRRQLDATVYGHDETKQQILRILAQLVTNPSARGHCIGLQGSPGTGKTSLVKNGIAKALGLPFGFIALGGANDGGFLDGHSYVYEGSRWGQISEVLMKAGAMNPVLFLDELDKVSSTRRGEEITNVLIHLTDATQNDRFCDKYFSDIDMDLSRALLIFSFNDASLVHPILRDRLTIIQTKGYSLRDKVQIARGYLLPEALEQYRMSPDDVQIPDAVIEEIIRRVPDEEGVRNLKRGLEAILGTVNIHRYLPVEGNAALASAAGEDGLLHLPVAITEDIARSIVRSASSIDAPPASMYL